MESKSEKTPEPVALEGEDREEGASSEEERPPSPIDPESRKPLLLEAIQDGDYAGVSEILEEKQVSDSDLVWR